MGCGRLAAGGPRPIRAAPRHYGERDGVIGQAAVMYRDSRGRLWVGTRGRVGSGLSWWAPEAGRFVSATPADGLPAMSTPSAFAEDRGGQLWIGTYDHGLARYRDGRFTMFTAADGAPDGMVTALLVDRSGRLWIGTNRDGLTRVDAPQADSPAFVTIGRTGRTSQSERPLPRRRSLRPHLLRHQPWCRAPRPRNRTDHEFRFRLWTRVGDGGRGTA